MSLFTGWQKCSMKEKMKAEVSEDTHHYALHSLLVKACEKAILNSLGRKRLHFLRTKMAESHHKRVSGGRCNTVGCCVMIFHTAWIISLNKVQFYSIEESLQYSANIKDIQRNAVVYT